MKIRPRLKLNPILMQRNLFSWRTGIFG